MTYPYVKRSRFASCSHALKSHAGVQSGVGIPCRDRALIGYGGGVRSVLLTNGMSTFSRALVRRKRCSALLS